jgi:DNA-binding IclR family transcriptional regulator
VSEVVATVSSTQRLVWHMHRRDIAPLHATSGGKAMLANPETGFPLGALNIAMPMIRHSRQVQERAVQVLLAGAQRARRHALASESVTAPLPQIR